MKHKEDNESRVTKNHSPYLKGREEIDGVMARSLLILWPVKGTH